MQISNMFKPDHPDTEYDRGKYMLTTLGLQVRCRISQPVSVLPGTAVVYMLMMFLFC
jgi:hypothetical protein